MQPEPEWADAPSLNKRQLAEHLSVRCYTTLDEILAKTGLRPAFGGYPWRRILRAVHGTEGALLPGHLASLKARHGTPGFDDIEDAAERAVARANAPGSPTIDEIADLEAALKEPLWSFAEMARALGEKPDTLCKALRQKRRSLPFPKLLLGPRLRLFRPLDVRLWRDEEILLELPAALRIVAAAPPAETPVVEREQEAESDAPTGDADAPTPADVLEKAVFGRFGPNSRKKKA